MTIVENAQTKQEGRLKIGLYLPVLTEDPLSSEQISVIRDIESAGFTSVWARDLTILSYTTEDIDPQYECLTLLTYLAAKTSRLMLGTAVVSLPLRNTALLAKQCASLDHLSGGRFILGIGTGYRDYEYDLFHVPYERRYDLMQASIKELRELWQGSCPQQPDLQASPSASPTGLRPLQPRPLRKEGPPIYYASNYPSLEWIAHHMDGWMIHRTPLSKLTESITVLRRQTPSGRHVEVTMDFAIALGHKTGAILPPVPGLNPLALDDKALVKGLMALESIGVNHVILALAGDMPRLAQMEILADKVLPYFAC